MPANGTTPASSDLSPTPPPSSDRTRCEPDPLDPSVVCLARVTADDRQGISHFFGRNKKATHTIPDGIFPILCRTHYQEKQYRWNESPGGLAAFQCDCVLKALERMAGKIWVDTDGIEWPYWCGFELQICKVTNAGEINSDRHQVPSWLRKLCKKKETRQDFIPIGDRGGARYDFLLLVSIVQSIKTWCMQENVRLPSVEALPIAIGMINEAEFEDAKAGLRVATREYNLASNHLTRAENEKTAKSKLKVLREALEQAQEGVDAAEEALDVARQDSEATKSLVPGKRLTKKQRKTATPDLMDGIESAESPLKRKHSGSVAQGRKKVKAMEE